MERLERLDVNVGTIGDMISEARNAAQELINSGYDAGTDRSLTTNQFFNRYLDHKGGFSSKDSKAQSEFLTDIIFDKANNMEFRGSAAVTDLMNKMVFKKENTTY